MSLWCYFAFEADGTIKTIERMFKTPSKALWIVKEEWIVDSKRPRHEDQSKDDKEIYHKITITSEEAMSYFAFVDIYDADTNINHVPLVTRVDFSITNNAIYKFSRYKQYFFRGKLPMKLCCALTLLPIFHPGYVQPTRLSHPGIACSVPFAKVKPMEARKNLSRNMESLLEKGTFSDISLVCESTEVKVHKNILEVRAPCFMMTTKSKEMENKKVAVDDMDLVVLRQMLTFIYTGRVTSKNVFVIRRLHTVADFYDMQEMENVCVYLLRKLLSSEVENDGT